MALHRSPFHFPGKTWHMSWRGTWKVLAFGQAVSFLLGPWERIELVVKSAELLTGRPLSRAISWNGTGI